MTWRLSAILLCFAYFFWDSEGRFWLMMAMISIVYLAFEHWSQRRSG